jgi:hypothetical protein
MLDGQLAPGNLRSGGDSYATVVWYPGAACPGELFITGGTNQPTAAWGNAWDIS